MVQDLPDELCGDIVPVRITLFDHLNLPEAIPVLDALFAADGFVHGVVALKPDKTHQAILPGERALFGGPVLLDAVRQVRADACVKRTSLVIGQDIDRDEIILRHEKEAPLHGSRGQAAG